MGRGLFLLTVVSILGVRGGLLAQELEPPVAPEPTTSPKPPAPPETPVAPVPSAGETVVVIESPSRAKVDYSPPTYCDDDLSVAEIATFGDWLGYNHNLHDLTWIPDGDDGLGILSFESYPHQKIGESSSLQMEFNFHFLNGPVRTDLPPRLFDFVLGYHSRHPCSTNITADVKYGIGIYSDFEGSARKGVRFPGHFVMHAQTTSQIATVLGIEVLDRDDISVLPVAGLILKPTNNQIYEFVFPRPKIQWLVDNDTAFYVSGELGGNTWAIERTNGAYDNATYRDLRIVAGAVDFGKTSGGSLEIGYIFARDLEYRSGVGDYAPEDSWLLRLRTHY